MKTRWIVSVTAVIALLVIALVIYNPWSRKPQNTSFATTVPDAASQAVSEVRTQPKEPTSQSVVAPPTAVESDFISSFPINDRPGHSQQSTDFLTALMHHQDLDLSKAEMEKLLTAYLEVGMERSHYEASIATIEVISSTQRTITIPAYPQEGAKLQAELYQKFAMALGVERAAQVQAALAPELYVRNHGFGDAKQQIRVRLMEGEPITYAFAHDTETLTVPYNGSYLTVKSTNADSTLSIGDLSAYTGLIDLLPKGGS